MLQISMKDALDEDTYQDAKHHYLYLYRDGETALYVGRSYDPIERLRQHMGQGRAIAADQVGDIIQDNLPASLAWTVELFTLADCLPLVARYMPGSHQHYTACLDRPEQQQELAKVAETAMIDHYRPCLNGSGARYYDHPVPERYIKRKIANRGVILGD